jgi:hypothetical protein
MKQNKIKIDGVYQTKINGRWCSVRVTASRLVPNTMSLSGLKTLFDWVLLNPPPGAKALLGSDPAARIRACPAAEAPVTPRATAPGDDGAARRPSTVPPPPVEVRDLSGDPAYDSAERREGWPVPKPESAIGQTSTLRVDMARNPVETIAAVAKAYAEEGDLDRAAIRFGARRRTLERLQVEYPALKQAIDDARNRANVL